MRRTSFTFPVSTLAGSSLGNIAALLENHHVEPKYRRKLIRSWVTAGIFEVFTQAERILWQKRIRDHRLKHPPIFIIGFWRSGTTLLHNLLCQDPETAYTTTFQTVFPNLVLTQSWWLKPLTNHFLPPNRPYDNVSMDMDFPQEEDFGLMNIQPATIYKFFLFPKEFDLIIEKELFTGKLPPEELSLWQRSYHSMIIKASINTGGKRYIGKNPCHLTRLGILRDMYPEAKFIFIHRHPYKVVESLYHFILSIYPGVQLQDTSPSFSRAKVAALYKRMMDAYLVDRKIIPAADLIELNLDYFLSDIRGNLKAIYDKFGLGDFGRASGRVDDFLENNAKPLHPASPPTMETIGLVDATALDIMHELGYQPYTSEVSIPSFSPS